MAKCKDAVVKNNENLTQPLKVARVRDASSDKRLDHITTVKKDTLVITIRN
jgi:hypothetical protein